MSDGKLNETAADPRPLWTFSTGDGTFLVDLKGGNVWRNGSPLDTSELTLEHHFVVLGKRLAKSPAIVSKEELREGIAMPDEDQPLYEVVHALRDKLGDDLINTAHRKGYALAVEARVVWRFPGAEPLPPITALPDVSHFWQFVIDLVRVRSRTGTCRLVIFFSNEQPELGRSADEWGRYSGRERCLPPTRSAAV